MQMSRGSVVLVGLVAALMGLFLGRSMGPKQEEEGVGGSSVPAPSPASPAAAPADTASTPSAPAALADAMPAALCAELAAAYARHDRIDKAMALYTKAVEQETAPERKAWHLTSLAQLHLRAQDTKEAEACFGQALKLVSDEKGKVHLLLRVSAVYAQAGMYKDAEKAMREVLRVSTDSASRRRAQQAIVRLSHKTGTEKTVLQELETRLEKNPKDQEAIKALAQAYVQAKATQERQKAIPLLEKLIVVETHPRQRAAYCFDAAMAYDQAGQSVQAIEALRKGIAALPDAGSQLRFYRQLAVVAMKVKQYDTAELAYNFILRNTASAREKEYIERQQLVLQKKQGRLPIVIQEYEKRLADHPDDIKTLEALAHIHWDVDRKPDKAKACYVKLVRLKPDDPVPLQRLAEACAALREYEKAVQAYETLLQLDPKNSRLYHERLSLLYQRVNKPDKARKSLEAMAKSNPKDAATLGRLAALYMEQDQTDPAVAFFRKAVAVSPEGYPRDQMRLQAATACKNKNQLTAARAFLDEIVASSKTPAIVTHAKRLQAEWLGQPAPKKGTDN